MHVREDRRSEGLTERIDSLHARISGAQRELLRLIAEGDRREVWRNSGARDMAHWISIRHGISGWKARRWIAAAHALEGLPRLSEAFSSGELGMDKVVELARFATAETEARLIRWAMGVSCACIRRKGDLAARQAIEEAQDSDRSRFLSWWYFDDGRRFGLEAELPAAEGAVVAKALERLADQLPAMPGEEGAVCADARRADALVALCSSDIAADADPDRATMVVHAQLDTLVSGGRGSELEGGGVIHPETARRLLCNARVQAVIEDEVGQPVRLGPDIQGALGVDDAPPSIPGSGMQVPGLWSAPVHPGPSHRVVGARRPDRSRQPGPRVHVPPQARARVRMVGRARPRRRSPVVPPRRDPPPGGPRATPPGDGVPRLPE